MTWEIFNLLLPRNKKYEKFCTGLIIFLCDVSCSHVKLNESTTANESEKTIQNFFKAFNDHDWKKVSEFYSDSALFLDPSFGNNFIKLSQSQVIQKHMELQKFLPDLKDSIGQVYICGDSIVIVEFVARGTTAKGNKFRLPICDVFKFRQGKIYSDATYFDQ